MFCKHWARFLLLCLLGFRELSQCTLHGNHFDHKEEVCKSTHGDAFFVRTGCCRGGWQFSDFEAFSKSGSRNSDLCQILGDVELS